MTGDGPRGPGFLVSGLLHAGAIALVFVSWPSTYEMPEMRPPEVLPVELLPAAETTNLKPQAKAETPKPEPSEPKAEPRPKPAPKAAAPEPAPEPQPKPEPEAAEAKPEPAPQPKPKPKPEPKPQPQKAEAKPEPKPEAKPKPEPKKPKPKPEPEVAEAKPEPKPKPKKPEPKPEPKAAEAKPAKKPEKKPAKEADEEFDLNAIVAGLDDEPDAPKAPAKPPKSDARSGDRDRPGAGDPNAPETLAVVDAMQQQIARCWSPPAGAPEGERVIVQLRIKMNSDGSLSGLPEYVEPGRLDEPRYRAAAEAARRAVMQCQPYELPAASYDAWRSLRLRFDPQKMMGL